MKQPNYLELYLIFLKIGALLLGGGYVIVPILQEELSSNDSMQMAQLILDNLLSPTDEFSIIELEV